MISQKELDDGILQGCSCLVVGLGFAFVIVSICYFIFK